MELAPLLKMVAGQVVEIEKLAQIAGASKDQTEALKTLNEGVNKTVSQIETIQEIVERAEGLAPSGVKSIRELNEYLERVTEIKEQIDLLLSIRAKAAELAVAQSSLQGDTAYKMGQEMIGTGSALSEESRTASPGRAAQISAASNSAQMMANGVGLQTMAQLLQLQAISLDLQRSVIEKDIQAKRTDQRFFITSLQNSNLRRKKKL